MLTGQMLPRHLAPVNYVCRNQLLNFVIVRVKFLFIPKQGKLFYQPFVGPTTLSGILGQNLFSDFNVYWTRTNVAGTDVTVMLITC